MKRYFKIIVLMFLLFITPNVYALNINNASSDIKRSELPNYGVNKKWKINDNNIDNVYNTPYVDASLKIYDYSEVLTEEEEIILYKKINIFIDKYKTDMAIVTVNIPSVGTQNEIDTEEFAADFYDYNDFGIDFENYSGILLVRNTYYADKYYDMYTFGNAQLYFDRARYDDILDSIYDSLHYDFYSIGFRDFIDRVNYYYEQGIPSSMENAFIDDMGYIKYYYRVPYALATVIAFVTTLVVIIIYRRKNVMVYKATNALPYYNKETSNISLKKDKFLHTYTRSYTVSSSSGGGSRSHRGSSGGGHSSGGGRHG